MAVLLQKDTTTGLSIYPEMFSLMRICRPDKLTVAVTKEDYINKTEVGIYTCATNQLLVQNNPSEFW